MATQSRLLFQDGPLIAGVRHILKRMPLFQDGPLFEVVGHIVKCRPFFQGGPLFDGGSVL